IRFRLPWNGTKLPARKNGAEEIEPLPAKNLAALLEAPLVVKASCSPVLLHQFQPCTQAGLLAIGHRFVDDFRFRGLVKCGTDAAKRFSSIGLFARSEDRKILFLQLMQAGFLTAIVQALAGAVSHAAFS